MAILDERDRTEFPGLYDLHDITAIQNQALGIAELLNNPAVQGVWREIHRTELDNVLGELKGDIESAGSLEVTFPKYHTHYSSRYNGLLSVMGINSSEGPGFVAARIPRDAITSIDVLPGQNSDHNFNPQLWLQIRTGEERQVQVFDRNRATTENPAGLTEIEPKGSWINFGLGYVSLKGIYSAKGIASHQVATQ